MSFQLNVPPSVMAKLAKSAGEGEEGEAPVEEGGQKKQSREDWKKLKELEEARKAGTAPAMKDEEGKDINPHIPQYIMQAPWYFGATAPTLKHQRTQEEKQRSFARMQEWYNRGVKEGPVATKFRKGACENCGALTHKKKDCLERPRKIGAKFTGSAIAPDEYIQPELSHDFDGKRDRWNGYDMENHKFIQEEFQKIEEAKRQLRGQNLDNTVEGKEEKKQEKGEDDDDDDEDKYADDVDMPGQKFETKQRITVRNLRIREDTAKYLYNLDTNSAYYDPKTRSMRENPFKNTGKDSSEVLYSGDNFVRVSGDAHNMASRQVFAWDAYEKGTDVHLQADPTKLEILAREYSKRKDDYKEDIKNTILEKYGGEEHLNAPPKQLLLAQTEDYVEYSRHGTVVKGQEKARIKSRYEEDVYINNHTSVWGSYWKDGSWGFACCHSVVKESYCTGTAGKLANSSSLSSMPPPMMPPPTAATSRALVHQEEEGSSASLVKATDEEHPTEAAPEKSKKKKKKSKKKRKRKHKKKKARSSSSEDSDSSDSEDDEEKAKEKRIQEAMKREEKREKDVARLMALDERKRPYNSVYEVSEPTEEELEAFKRRRYNPEDPMANFL